MHLQKGVMMAASSKEELQTVTRKEFDKLSALIATVDDATALQKDEDGVSIKDVVAHRAHWIDLFLGWYRDGAAGKTVHFPAEGYKWNDLKRYNANLRAQQVDLGWAAATNMLDRKYAALTEFIDALPEADLYGGPMKGAHNKWTPGRWAEAAGPSHFRSAAKYIRGRLRHVEFTT